MSNVFAATEAFNAPIGGWNTSQVTSMFHMFYQATAFNAEIGNWDTLKVTNMNFMFFGASSFNQFISSWVGPAASTAQTNIFAEAIAFKERFSCARNDDSPIPQSCTQINADWSFPSPPPEAPSPPPSPPSPPPSPPPPPPTMITDDNFHVAIDTCLKMNNGVHAATGLCEESEYRSMPGWDTSRVTDMSSAFFLFDHISSFDGDIT